MFKEKSSYSLVGDAPVGGGGGVFGRGGVPEYKQTNNYASPLIKRLRHEPFAWDAFNLVAE